MSGSGKTQQAVQQAGTGYPASLAGINERYRDLCAVLPLPDLRTEAWHYGKPDRFLPGKDTAAAELVSSARGDIVAALLQDCGPAVIIRLGLQGAAVQGSPAEFGGSVSALMQGTDLAEYPALHGWLQFLAERECDRLEAEQLSRLQQILLIDIDKSVPAGLPIHIIVDMPPDGKHRCEQIVINAATGTTAALHLHVAGNDMETQSLLHLGVHLNLADNSRLNLVRYQDTGKGCDIRGMETQYLGKHASCTSTSLFAGGSHMRHDVISALAGQGSESILRGLYKMGGRQTASIFSHQDHRVPNAHSNLLFKGTLLDRSAASYLGQITVAPDAQGTDAYQSNRSLLLSPRARSNSSPQLEIEANDVRCSHGASVANVSGDELFYLESRGIDPESGRQLLISGFLAEIADLVPEGPLRAHVYGVMLDRRY